MCYIIKHVFAVNLYESRIFICLGGDFCFIFGVISVGKLAFAIYAPACGRWVSDSYRITTTEYDARYQFYNSHCLKYYFARKFKFCLMLKNSEYWAFCRRVRITNIEFEVRVRRVKSESLLIVTRVRFTKCVTSSRTRSSGT